MNSPLWDTWLRDEHGLRRQSCFVDRPPTPCRHRVVSPPQTHAHRRVCALTPMPSLSPSPPPPPLMPEEEEAELMRRVMEDSINMHVERQWVGLETALALSTADDTTIPKLE
ncbi:hypothetical protein D1007_53534 [Hordeum vulgare]|nr:hypothetical protein D1007_53534 [Hordeum vulgare]